VTKHFVLYTGEDNVVCFSIKKCTLTRRGIALSHCDSAAFPHSITIVYHVTTLETLMNLTVWLSLISALS